MNKYVDKVARAVLYEGYILYPYRPSSVKNRQRWTFGGLYPQTFVGANPGADRSFLQAQCLASKYNNSTVSLSLRFLHLTQRAIEQRVGQAYQPVESLEIDGQIFQAWQEAVEREVALGPNEINTLLAQPIYHSFAFSSDQTSQSIEHNHTEAGRIIRRRQPITGSIEISGHRRSADICQLNVRVQNICDGGDTDRDDALLHSLVSAHLILTVTGGAFISATDPPEHLRDCAEQCQNIGCWPVLVGEEGAADTLLVSPIILPDYPRVADESPGDLFDGCEIDEILTLRILTMTADEKRHAAAADPMAADLLARTESLARRQMMNLHGTIRDLNPVPQTITTKGAS